MQKASTVSASKAILGALWKEKELTREKIKKHKYVASFCASKSDVTFRGSLMRLLDTQMIAVNMYGLYTLHQKAHDKAIMSFINIESHLAASRQVAWDGSWRIVIFNIPEAKRVYRDRLRQAIRGAGFRQIQSGVWIYPYPVPPFLKTIFANEHIKPYLRFITTKNIERDSDLKKIFNLK